MTTTTRSWKAPGMGGGQVPRYRDGRIATRNSDCGMVDESGEETDIDERMAEISEIDAQQQAAEQAN